MKFLTNQLVRSATLFNLDDSLKLRTKYTATLLKKTLQNNDSYREKLEFLENIQPAKYCFMAWFQVIFCSNLLIFNFNVVYLLLYLFVYCKLAMCQNAGGYIGFHVRSLKIATCYNYYATKGGVGWTGRY